ncbi:hypothetical protein ABZ348_00730 [Streptomyces sp. NPDC005963]|uniref:hypothetical protein n=1 Tax=Streptomyces sp. NPDC005963 TaxID=3156721 RepID=UPI0033FFEB30
MEEIATELYGLNPSEFIAARDAYAARARRAGEKQTAGRITELRRPTRAAWAANLLARHDPDETERFLRLGQGLREAHLTLDPARLRELSHQQHRVITTLARQAVALAEEAGQPLTQSVHQEVERTLRAVLSDPETAEVWAAGRLVKAADASVGFGGLEPEALPPRSAEVRDTTADRTTSGSRSSSATTAAGRTKGAKESRRATRLEVAREAARAAVAEAGHREDSLHSVEQEHDRATALLADAEELVTDLTMRLRQARADRNGMRSTVDETAKRLREAEKEAKAARHASAVAARAVDRLTDSG